MNTLPRARLHLATCKHCGRLIAWSPRRRQWLALAPLLRSGHTHVIRCLMCPATSRSGFHDPRPNH